VGCCLGCKFLFLFPFLVLLLSPLIAVSNLPKRLQLTKTLPFLTQTITPLNLLPLTANGSLPQIRASAQSLPSLPTPLPRLLPHVLTWTITALSQQRQILANRKFEADTTRKVLEQELAQKSRDLVVFAGLVKFRLGRGVYEMLAGEGFV
jgi:hypothetical protein